MNSINLNNRRIKNIYNQKDWLKIKLILNAHKVDFMRFTYSYNYYYIFNDVGFYTVGSDYEYKTIRSLRILPLTLEDILKL